MSKTPGEVTLLLAEWSLGRKDALARLTPFIDRELRRIAGHYMREECLGYTLQPTALGHETFLRLIYQVWADWRSRAEFVGVAAGMMRRPLVDHARRRLAAKRGPAPVTLTDTDFEIGAVPANVEEILAVDALKRLGRLDPKQARIVELRYFGGLLVEELATALEISSRRLKRDWGMAKWWLWAQLTSGAPV